MALKLNRTCSTDEFFITRSSALTTHLTKRGYKHCLVKDAIEKVSQILRSSAFETSIQKESLISFVISFNPGLPIIPQVISSNLNILRSSQRCLTAFSSPPRISHRRCKNVRDILVRAKHRRQVPPGLRELSVVTEIGARRALLLQREPHLTLFSLQVPTNKDTYDITSPGKCHALAKATAKAKATVRGFKWPYQDCKRRSGKKSFNSWVVDKGYRESSSGCWFMQPPRDKRGRRWSGYIDNALTWKAYVLE